VEGPEYSFVINQGSTIANDGENGEAIGDLFNFLKKVNLKDWMNRTSKDFGKISNCLFFIRSDEARVHINIPVQMKFIGKTDTLARIPAGASVTRDNIIDIESIELMGVDILSDTSYVQYHQFMGKKSFYSTFYRFTSIILTWYYLRILYRS
jgi:hypothetical protein